MDLLKFDMIMKSQGLRYAILYKNKFIPRILYKYVPLLDERFVDYEKENDKKLDTLKKNEIWVSHYQKLNDPFEYKMLYLDKERISEAGWDVKEIESFLEFFKNRTLLSCFSTKINNIPMWSHYANNHKGFCIKYKVKNPDEIFEIRYEPKREKSAVIFTNIFYEALLSYKNKLVGPTNNFYQYFTYFYMSFSCKYCLWKYEDEYRLLHMSLDITDGKRISLDKAGLEVDAIYIGCKCPEKYAKELLEIGNALGCEVYKMEFDEYSEKFELYAEKIN